MQNGHRARKQWKKGKEIQLVFSALYHIKTER